MEEKLDEIIALLTHMSSKGEDESEQPKPDEV